MTVYIGCDPGIHQTAFVSLEGDKLAPVVKRILVIQGNKKLKGVHATIEMCAVLPCFQVKSLSPVLETVVVLAVEGQEQRPRNQGKSARPEDLINLANVTGAVLASVRADKLYRPTPTEWKGSKPKRVQQARTCAIMGWNYELHGTGDKQFCVPTGITLDLMVERLKFDIGALSNWSHVMDALGLALWGMDKSLTG